MVQHKPSGFYRQIAAIRADEREKIIAQARAIGRERPSRSDDRLVPVDRWLSQRGFR